MFIDFLKVVYYELKALFVIEKVKYKINGKCNQCGKCCSFMYALDTYTESEFNLMTKLFPKYKRFKIIDKDEYGLILACDWLTSDGKCKDYKNRLPMCKKYPNINRRRFGAKTIDGCGYSVYPEKSFDKYLK